MKHPGRGGEGQLPPTGAFCRELTSSDQEVLWELEYLALWDPPSEPRRPRSVLELPRIRRLVEGWGRDEDFGLAAIDPESHRVMGGIWTRLDGYDGLEDYGCPYPALGIAVFPQYQELGIGSQLMSAFVVQLRWRVDGLRLGVHPKNARARRLYAKFGFVEYAVGAGGYPQMKLDFTQHPTVSPDEAKEGS